MEWKKKLTRTPYLVLFTVLIAIGVGTASAMITITLAGNVIITDDLTVDTDTLVVDSSEDKVGIRTNSPSETLDVNGNVAVDGSLDVSNAPIISHRAPNTPSSNLVIERIGGPTTDNVQFTLSHRPTNKDLWIYGFDGTTFKNFVGFDYPNYKINFPVNGDALVIDGANDRVGMGTTNPESKLHVVGDVQIDGNYTYTTNQTRHLVIPGNAFVPRSDASLEYSILGFHTFNHKTTDGAPAEAYAPLHLPDGATITKLSCNIRDFDSNVDFVVHCDLHSGSFGSGSTSRKMHVSNTTSGSGPGYTISTDGQSHVYDSFEHNILYVKFDPVTTNCSDAKCHFNEMAIEYQVSEVD